MSLYYNQSKKIKVWESCVYNDVCMQREILQAAFIVKKTESSEMQHFWILTTVLLVVCALCATRELFCIPVTPYTKKIVGDRSKCLCPIADPMGADEYSKTLPPIHCKMSVWLPESDCIDGAVEQVWTRKVVVNPANGGRECPKNLVEKRAC